MAQPVKQPAIRCAAKVEALLGEGPLWDPRINRLLFLDIKGARLFIYDPATDETHDYDVSGMVSALGLARKGGYVCVSRQGFGRLFIEDDAVRIEPVIDPESALSGNRFNDGKVDPAGGFWAGTMDDQEKDDNAGSWWRLAPDGTVARLDDGHHVTNGPAFDPARGRVYLTDSARRVIYVADSDGTAFKNKTVFKLFGDGAGYPDGMDIDAQGSLWVAFWDGAMVRRFSSEGVLLGEFAIPALRPTSVKIVAHKIYVTSARIGLTPEQLCVHPESGGLFVLELPVSVGPDNYNYFSG